MCGNLVPIEGSKEIGWTGIPMYRTIVLLDMGCGGMVVASNGWHIQRHPIANQIPILLGHGMTMMHKSVIVVDAVMAMITIRLTDKF
jgi:hypothetical protein